MSLQSVSRMRLPLTMLLPWSASITASQCSTGRHDEARREDFFRSNHRPRAGSPFPPLQTGGWNPKTPEINDFLFPKLLCDLRGGLYCGAGGSPLRNKLGSAPGSRDQV